MGNLGFTPLHPPPLPPTPARGSRDVSEVGLPTSRYITMPDLCKRSNKKSSGCQWVRGKHHISKQQRAHTHITFSQLSSSRGKHAAAADLLLSWESCRMNVMKKLKPALKISKTSLPSTCCERCISCGMEHVTLSKIIYWWVRNKGFGSKQAVASKTCKKNI